MPQLRPTARVAALTVEAELAHVGVLDGVVLLVGGTRTAEAHQGILVRPLLEDVDPTRIDEVWRQGEVHATLRRTGLRHHALTAGEVVLSTCWVDEQSTSHDDHDTEASAGSSCRAASGTCPRRALYGDGDGSGL